MIVISDPEENPEEQTAEATGWHLLWAEKLTDEELDQFNKHGYRPGVFNRFKALRDGKTITKVRRVSRERLDDFIPHLLFQIADAESPDISLQRFCL